MGVHYEKAAPRNQGAENLNELLERKGIGAEKLARKLDVPVQEVYNWINGHGVPETHYTIKMARILRCKLSEVYLAIIRTPLSDHF